MSKRGIICLAGPEGESLGSGPHFVAQTVPARGAAFSGHCFDQQLELRWMRAP